MQSGGPEPVQPRKRGRKPGPFSRSAREAQRKLSHSIIEKARRTKINEALAALRQLVPSDFSRRPSAGNPPSNNNRRLNTNSDDEIEDEDDKGEEDHEYHNSLSAAALSGTAKNGKKREEKEFKLEVLERTVAYLQVLTQRYDELKMRHDQLEMNTGDRRHSQSRCSTERRYREYRECAQNSATASRKRSRSDAGSVIAVSTSNSDRGSVTLPFTVSGGSADERPSKRHEPLPPISSWLPHSPNATRSTLSPSTPSTKCNDECASAAVTPVLSSQLPTPPSSALFQPLFSGAHCYATHSTIPSLSLDPKALPPPCQLHARRLSFSSSPPRVLTSGRLTKPGNNNHVIKRFSHLHSERVPATDASHPSPHTPEDQNAASLLLTMGLQPSPLGMR